MIIRLLMGNYGIRGPTLDIARPGGPCGGTGGRHACAVGGPRRVWRLRRLYERAARKSDVGRRAEAGAVSRAGLLANPGAGPHAAAAHPRSHSPAQRPDPPARGPAP